MEPITGEVFEEKDAGLRLKLGDGTYMSNPIPWGVLSQDDLKALQQEFEQNPRVRSFIEPFIAIPEAQKLQQTDIGTTNAVPRLERPPRSSLVVALGGSGGGLLILLLVYAGNLYAAYEISIFRSQPVGLVCGVSAVLPIFGPIIFLAMPRREPGHAHETYEAPDENLEAAIAAEQAPASTFHARTAHSRTSTQAVAAPGTLPATKTFVRGQTTFNRRFFETQMPGFFAVVRPNADKDLVLTFKTGDGTRVVERISRISQADAHVQVRKGHGSEEFIIPFEEIQEVQLKHKDA